ncbi:shikimate kinase [Olsenella sp. An188]|uniref:shikimate kinase n=1 Tax=Olsenella sp. An188 TaxID=1965579 RepID=UPI000B3A9C3A|nr:shikimate kinase [Olsenella sp. An188]OUP39451.1 shikimate kinase [Olsenella sp. An188]
MGEKDLDAAPFGLVGRTLGHSWSRQIHERLGSAPYALHELEPDEVAPFVRDGAWCGLNVTIPYKRRAAELANERSPRVERLGAANTLVRREDGSILAENTDVLGFFWMLTRFCRRELGSSVSEALGSRKALVLGSGGASQAVRLALEEYAGMDVVTVSRSGKETYEGLARRHADAALVVNTTPVGMFPNCPASPLDEATLSALTGLVAVLDVVYNPRRTGLLLAAERLGLPAESGLAMLVAQALYASELFQGRNLDDSLVAEVEGQIRAQTENVVLIGMPGAGKSSCGRALARLLGRPFVDVDEAIALECGRSAAQIIREDGEEAFRAVETEVTGRYAARSGLVLACGGGVVTREENRDLIRQNARVVFLDRPIAELSDDGRPMSQTKGVERLAAERMDAYRSWADVTLPCTGSPAGDAELARRLLVL